MRVSPGAASFGREVFYFLQTASVTELKPKLLVGTFAITSGKGA